MKKHFLITFISLLAFTTLMVSCIQQTSSEGSDIISTTQHASKFFIADGDVLNLQVGESKKLSVQTDLIGPITYTSLNESIASVDENGLITAISEGITSITASIGDVKDSIDVFVSESISISSLEISLTKTEMMVNEFTTIQVRVDPEEYLDEVRFEIIKGSDLISLEGDSIQALKSGDVSLQAVCGDAVSNVVELHIYDFEITMSSQAVLVSDHERVSIIGYAGNKTALNWNVENPNIIFLEFSAVGELFVNGSSIGSTSFYLYDDEGLISNILEVEVLGGNPYLDIDKNEFYDDYTRATSYVDAMYRTECDLMSGWIEVPDQEPTISSYQPQVDGKLIHNTDTHYSNQGNTYTVVDAYGNKAFDIYYGAAYTSLEEVAAYIYAWGDIPANYTESKNALPTNSPWGEYLRLNNSYFSGDTNKYIYEPELPDISGCYGNLAYYEIDIGTTGTDCDPSHAAIIYNDGENIKRGAARIVYSRYYVDTGEPVRPEDRYVFYTYNHYNDFQEYLNYANGWGEMFGNITGGGVISSMNPNSVNPTPYIETIRTTLP